MDFYRWFYVWVFVVAFGLFGQVSIAKAQSCTDITNQLILVTNGNFSRLIDGDIGTRISTNSTGGHQFQLPPDYYVCDFTFATNHSQSANNSGWYWGISAYTSFDVDPYPVNQYSTILVNAEIDQLAFDPQTSPKRLSEIQINGYFIGGGGTGSDIYPVGSGPVYDWLPARSHWVVVPLIVTFISVLMGSFSSKNTFAWQVGLVVFMTNYAFSSTSILVTDQFLFSFSIMLMHWFALWAGGMVRYFK